MNFEATDRWHGRGLCTSIVPDECSGECTPPAPSWLAFVGFAVCVGVVVLALLWAATG